jgi:ankyrin repeat protein
MQNNAGDTPLHVAVEDKLINTAIFLKEQGADIEAINAKGMTALQCFFVSTNYDKLPMLRALVKAGANVNVLYEDGDTLLHKSIGHETSEFLQMFLEASNKNIDTKDKRCYAPLLKMYHYGERTCREFLQLFLDHKADFNTKDANGSGVLHCAARAKDHESFELIVNAGVDIDAADESGLTALHIAMIEDDVEGVRKLLSLGQILILKTVQTVLHGIIYCIHITIPVIIIQRLLKTQF